MKPKPGAPGTTGYTEKMLADKEFRAKFRNRAIECGSVSICCHELNLYKPALYTLSVEDKELRDWFTTTREAVHWALVDSVPETLADMSLTPKEKHLRVWGAFMQADRLVPSLARNLRGGLASTVNITNNALQVVSEEQRQKLIELFHSKRALDAGNHLPVIDVEPKSEPVLINGVRPAFGTTGQ
jgi:hypothetical protein